MAWLWPFLRHWLTDDKAGLTLATWCLVLATFMLVATGVGAIGFAAQQLAAERNQTKYLSAWIANNVYLPLDESPFDREDSTLNPDSGACSNCPRRSGYNTSLFSDVTGGDQCLDASIHARRHSNRNSQSR